MQDNLCKKGKQRQLAINHQIVLSKLGRWGSWGSRGPWSASNPGQKLFFHLGRLNAVGVMLPSLADYRMAFLWTKTSCILAKISESTALHTLGSRIPSTSWFPPSRERERGPNTDPGKWRSYQIITRQADSCAPKCDNLSLGAISAEIKHQWENIFRIRRNVVKNSGPLMDELISCWMREFL